MLFARYLLCMMDSAIFIDAWDDFEMHHMLNSVVIGYHDKTDCHSHLACCERTRLGGNRVRLRYSTMVYVPLDNNVQSCSIVLEGVGHTTMSDFHIIPRSTTKIR